MTPRLLGDDGPRGVDAHAQGCGQEGSCRFQAAHPQHQGRDPREPGDCALRAGLPLGAIAPHVPTGEITLLPSEARDHEPRISLDGGSDGLDVVRRIAAQARPWLTPGGHLLAQTHPDQAVEALKWFTRGGLDAHAVVDEDERSSLIVGRRPAPSDRNASASPRATFTGWTRDHHAEPQGGG